MFNNSPKKGIDMLIQRKFIASPAEDPDQAALFLGTTPGISKTALGEYLGEGDAVTIKVMHKFVELLDFTNLGFVAALRIFLERSDCLAKRRRLIELSKNLLIATAKATRNVFASADTAYVLAFSVIMLNTDQHSSKIKNRMEKADFLKNNRGVNGGGEFGR